MRVVWNGRDCVWNVDTWWSYHRNRCWWALFEDSLLQIMSALVEKGKPTEDLGTILARVQDDLQLLRSTVARASDGAVDMGALDSVLSRTEKGVQAASERVLSSDLGHVTTLPAVYETEGGMARRRGERSRSQRGRRKTQSGSQPGLLELAEQSSKQSPIHQTRYSTLTPGEQCQTLHRARLVAQPSLPATRKLLSQHYSLPSTPSVRIAPGSKVTGKLCTGGTIQPLAVLPETHRKNAVSTPPPISEEDVQKGLLSLIERQLIPPAADIVLNPPPVKSATLELLSASQQFRRPKIAVQQDVAGHLVGVRLAPDPVTVPLVEHCQPTPPPATTTPTPTHTMTLKPIQKPSVHVIQAPDLPNQLSKQVQFGSIPAPPATSDLQITVKDGHLLTTAQEYQDFQSSQPQKWQHISAVLNQLEALCQNYAVPMATARCGRLLELASEHELGLRIRRQELVSGLVNGEDVKELISRPGQRYRGEGGLHAAATTIQATYRMYSQRCGYLNHLRKVWAVGVISTAWTLFTRRCGVREKMNERRARELAGQRSRVAGLGKRWSKVQAGKRVLIHLPSLGHPSCVRGTEMALNMEQSLQLARITDIQDPNVEVVYISPVAVDSEVLDYYTRLLAMGPAGSETAMDRVHIITPDHLHSFPSHTLPLSTLLTLSPRTVQRVRRLIAGREAYIVPGVVNRDDLSVADMLGVPLLGPDNETSHLYSSKDGGRKIFSEANVPTPPYVTDIVSEVQLVEQLARLVAGHPSIHRWIFKLPHQTRARGFAYCDISEHLQCYQWLVRESERYGDNWANRWAQDQAVRRISSELLSILKSHATPVDSDLYPTWGAFLSDFLIKGGLIEGHPPSTSVTSLTVDMLIEPTGAIQILSTHDQVCAHPYRVWGGTVPQSSVPPETLLCSAREVGVACRERGVIGHLSIDFVTFIHPKTMTQELWAVDLDLRYSNHLALQRLLSYVTGATVDPASGQLMVDSGPRFAVMSPRLYHTNLPVVHYPVFFQMCKAHHIGYNTLEKVGTVFALIDREHKEHMGIICLQPSLSEALTSCSTTLSTIHHQISTPLMQGRSNFKAVCVELDTVASLVQENTLQEDEESR